MIQIGIGLVGLSLIVIGIRALSGTEPNTAAEKKYGIDKSQTSPGVAIASIVIGALLVIFGAVGLPLIFQLL